MSTRGRSIRQLLILLSLVSLVTTFAAVLWPAAGDPALVVAAKDGDFDTVRALVAKNANVNEPGRDGSTALLWAVHHSDVRMVSKHCDVHDKQPHIAPVIFFLPRQWYR